MTGASATPAADPSPAGAPPTGTDASPALAVRGLVAGYDGVAVVHGVDLSVAPGEVVALLGANGAGKSTVLRTVSGLLPRLGGEVEVLGEPVPARRSVRGGDVVALVRRGLVHVPEDRGLFFDLTVAEHLRLARRRGRPSRTDDELFGWFPVLKRLADRRAGLLSGGEQQMLALARALASAPRVLLVDEMSLGLAPIVVEGLLPVLRAIADATGTAMLVVEQHVGLVLEIADRGVVLQRGRVVDEGTAADLSARRATLEAGYLGDVTES